MVGPPLVRRHADPAVWGGRNGVWEAGRGYGSHWAGQGLAAWEEETPWPGVRSPEDHSARTAWW